MANLWLKIKVWSKITLFSVLSIYVFLFLYSNSGKPVKVWLFFNYELDRSTLWLAMTAFIAGVVTTLVARMLFSTVRQVRELREHRRQQQLQKDVADMHAKAAMLQTKPTADDKSDDAKPEA
jgi:lysylphosphatidylglycerol synthetase-like protein (DUF2156 family)